MLSHNLDDIAFPAHHHHVNRKAHEKSMNRIAARKEKGLVAGNSFFPMSPRKRSKYVRATQHLGISTRVSFLSVSTLHYLPPPKNPRMTGPKIMMNTAGMMKKISGKRSF